ncbi:uncharacterized protein LOC106457430 [Limulus polyphemus]|uniref:Uncharacterized protein LOC106457430 n=1 Tax=Limulus polyphemus TaxID=6850 RepID=A0ABM1B0I9_LIMPO|nr:uncharacterized protein LOC106457430 [Limulus polyphemus]
MNPKELFEIENSDIITNNTLDIQEIFVNGNRDSEEDIHGVSEDDDDFTSLEPPTESTSNEEGPKLKKRRKQSNPVKCPTTVIRDENMIDYSSEDTLKVKEKRDFPISINEPLEEKMELKCFHCSTAASSAQENNNLSKDSLIPFSRIPPLIPISHAEVSMPNKLPNSALTVFQNPINPFFFPVLPQTQGQNTTIDMSNGNLGSTGIRIFNQEAFCDICQKEFCNKYFLKTHKANKHGIYSADLIPSCHYGGTLFARSLGNELSLPPHMLLKPSTTISTSSQGIMNIEAYCEFCQKEFCNKYFLKKHKFKAHGIGKPSQADLTNGSYFDTKFISPVSSSPSSPATNMVVEKTSKTSEIKPLEPISDNLMSINFSKDIPVIQAEKKITASTEFPVSQGDSVVVTKPVSPDYNNQMLSIHSSKEQLECKKDREISKELETSSVDSFSETGSKKLCNNYFLHEINQRKNIINASGRESKSLELGNTLSENSVETFKIENKDNTVEKSLLESKIVKDYDESITEWTNDVSNIPSVLKIPRFHVSNILNSSQDIMNSEAYCQLCEKEFCNKYFLKKHQFKMHGIGDPSQANLTTGSYCDAKFTSPESSSPSSPTNSLTVEKINKTLEIKSIEPKSDMLISYNFPQGAKLDQTEQQIAVSADLHSPQVDSVVTTTLGSSGYHNNFVSVSSSKGYSECEKDKVLFTTEKLKEIGVINVDAFCEICCKEFCNKYFLRTHRQKKHGINFSDVEKISMQLENPASKSPSLYETFSSEKKDFLEKRIINENNITECYNDNTGRETDISTISSLLKIPQFHASIIINSDPGGVKAQHQSSSVNLDKKSAQIQKENISKPKEEVTSFSYERLHAVTGNSNNSKNGTNEEYYNQNKNNDKLNNEDIRNVNLKKELCGTNKNHNPSVSNSSFKFLSNTSSNTGVISHSGIPDNSLLPINMQNLSFIINDESEKLQSINKCEKSGVQESLHIPEINNTSSVNTNVPKKHTRSNYCNACNKELCNKYFMKTHMLKMHGIDLTEQPIEAAKISTIGGVTCDVCQKELCSKYFLKVHKQNTHGIYEDSSSKEMKEIPLNKTFKKDIPYSMETCPLCDRKFKDTKWLKLHIVNDHNNTVKESLLCFQNRMSNGIENICTYCEKSFADKVDLQVHVIKNHHFKTGKYFKESKTCSDLEINDSNVFTSKKVCKNEMLLERKKEQSTEAKTYHFNFSSGCSSNYHVNEKKHILTRNETLGKYVCIICHCSFQNHQSLQHHLLNHVSHEYSAHKDKKTDYWNYPVSLANMEDCLSSNTKNSSCKIQHTEHQKSKSKKYRCSKCNKKFSSKEHCLCHIYSAHNRKKYYVGFPKFLKRHKFDMFLYKARVKKVSMASKNNKCKKIIDVPNRDKHKPSITVESTSLSQDSGIKKTESNLGTRPINGDDKFIPNQSNVEKKTSDKVPLTYAMPQKLQTGTFIMQPFFLAQPQADGVAKEENFVPSLVYLPVCQKVSHPMTMAFSLTPA